MKVPSQVMKDALAALPDEYMTAREIWARMGLWAMESVRGQLNQLYRMGKAERISRKREPGGTQTVNLYRRARLPIQERAA